MALGRGVLLALLVFASVAAVGCDGDGGDESRGQQGNSGASGASHNEGAKPITSLEDVDVSALGEGQRKRWVTLVNDQLSPCGDPVSVARCVAEDRECDRCLQAAKYLRRLVAGGYGGGEIEELYRLRYAEETKLEIPIEDAPVRGSSMAPVTIVEFSDFECPFCAQAYPMLERVVRKSDGQAKLVFKHFPLDSHAHAKAAARAAVAAGKQGKFWPMHDKLFENQGRLKKADLERYAREIGLDVEQFREDLESEETRARVEQDKEDGRELGIKGTPAIFVEGRRFEEPLRALPAYIEEELGQ